MLYRTERLFFLCFKIELTEFRRISFFGGRETREPRERRESTINLSRIRTQATLAKGERSTHEPSLLEA